MKGEDACLLRRMTAPLTGPGPCLAGGGLPAGPRVYHFTNKKSSGSDRPGRGSYRPRAHWGMPQRVSIGAPLRHRWNSGVPSQRAHRRCIGHRAPRRHRPMQGEPGMTNDIEEAGACRTFNDGTGGQQGNANGHEDTPHPRTHRARPARRQGKAFLRDRPHGPRFKEDAPHPAQ